MYRPMHAYDFVDDEEVEQNHCCCGFIHVKNGVILIALLSFVFLFYSADVDITFYHMYGSWFDVTKDLNRAIWFAVALVCTCCLLVAMVQGSPQMLLPYAFYTGLCIGTCLITIAIVIFSYAFPTGSVGEFILAHYKPLVVQLTERMGHRYQLNDKALVRIVSVALAFVSILRIVFYVWCLDIIRGCFNYFKQKNRLTKSIKATINYGAIPTFVP